MKRRFWATSSTCSGLKITQIPLANLDRARINLSPDLSTFFEDSEDTKTNSRTLLNRRRFREKRSDYHATSCVTNPGRDGRIIQKYLADRTYRTDAGHKVPQKELNADSSITNDDIGDHSVDFGLSHLLESRLEDSKNSNPEAGDEEKSGGTSVEGLMTEMALNGMHPTRKLMRWRIMIRRHASQASAPVCFIKHAE